MPTKSTTPYAAKTLPTNPEHTLPIEQTCFSCHEVKHVMVNPDHLEKWKAGGVGNLIQDTMPTLNGGEREFLISSMCEHCFDAMFADTDDD